ncbi:MAG: CRTAC1 family protein [Acidobacteriota bacterium]
MMERTILMGASLCLILTAVILARHQTGSAPEVPAIKVVNVAGEAGLTHRTIYGGEQRNRYLLETTGCGVAWIDYDNDGWLDLFFVNGTRLEGFAKGPGRAEPPVSRLYRNNGNGSFTDVTRAAGVGRNGWGQAVCVGDYDNDGFEDLFVTYYGRNLLWRNNGNGTFSELADKAGVAGTRNRWGSGAAFIDYDKDGQLDLFVANYIDLDLKTAPTPESGPCLYKGLTVACGPPGLTGARNILYHNEGNGVFRDVSEKSGILATNGTYGLGVLTSDFDNDGWTDIYVANDSAPATLYRNNHDGTFTDIAAEAGAAYSGDGKPQAGMGVTAADYDGDGWLDIFKTNFSGDTSTLYRNLGTKLGGVVFDDMTFPSGIGLNTRWLGWGCGFIDIDNDGWRDILLVNGHVYPEVTKLNNEAGYAQRKVLYQNLRNGVFRDITEKIGGALLEPIAGRGAAFGDYDNDGDMDVVINPVNATPALLRVDGRSDHHWVAIRLHGVKANRSGLGARVRITADGRTQFDDQRSGGSYYSQNDPRLHFGLGQATQITTLEVNWPSGTVDRLSNLPVDQLIHIREGVGRIEPRQKK